MDIVKPLINFIGLIWYRSCCLFALTLWSHYCYGLRLPIISDLVELHTIMSHHFSNDKAVEKLGMSKILCSDALGKP